MYNKDIPLDLLPRLSSRYLRSKIFTNSKNVPLQLISRYILNFQEFYFEFHIFKEVKIGKISKLTILEKVLEQIWRVGLSRACGSGLVFISWSVVFRITQEITFRSLFWRYQKWTINALKINLSIWNVYHIVSS